MHAEGLLKWIVAAVAAVTLSVGASEAADLEGRKMSSYGPDDVRAPIRSIWDGVYYGGSIGYGWGESEHYYDRNDNHGVANQELDGALASITAGYNFRISPAFLVGVEGDLGVMDLNADDKVIFDGHVWKSQFGPFWGTLRARAGWLFGNLLFYGTGGIAFMSVDEVGIGDADGQTADNRSVRSGWVVGAGVEYALTSRMTTKLEYLHMDFGRYEGYSENQEDYYFDNRVDLVRAGLNVKF